MPANQWKVPTEEDMPEDGKEVLVVAAEDGCPIIYIATWSERDDAWMHADSLIEIDQVIFWMPLPELPSWDFGGGVDDPRY
jgi:hypothetical protein